MEQKQNTVNDIINELKRLQIEHGDIPIVRFEEHGSAKPEEAWPAFNEKENRIEF